MRTEMYLWMEISWTNPYLAEKSFGECDIEFPYQVLNDKQFVMGNNWTSSSEQPQLNCGLY